MELINFELREFILMTLSSASTNNGNVSRHLFTCLSKCFASFKFENSNSREMAVNILNMKQDKNFYINLGAKGHTYVRTQKAC